MKQNSAPASTSLVKTRQFARVSRRRFAYIRHIVSIAPFVEDDIFALSRSRLFLQRRAAQRRQALSRCDSTTVKPANPRRIETLSRRRGLVVPAGLRRDTPR